MSNVDVFTIGLDQIHDLQIRNRGYIVDFDATNTEVVWGSWLVVYTWSSFGKPSHFVYTADFPSKSDAVAYADGFMQEDLYWYAGILGRGYYCEVWHVVDDSEVEWFLTSEGEGITYPVYQRYELESYLGVYVDEYDVDAIEREVTKYNPVRGCLVWSVFGDDLTDVCIRHELPCPPPDDYDPEPVDWYGEMGDTLGDDISECIDAWEYVRAIDEMF